MEKEIEEEIKNRLYDSLTEKQKETMKGYLALEKNPPPPNKLGFRDAFLVEVKLILGAKDFIDDKHLVRR